MPSPKFFNSAFFLEGAVALVALVASIATEAFSFAYLAITAAWFGYGFWTTSRYKKELERVGTNEEDARSTVTLADGLSSILQMLVFAGVFFDIGLFAIAFGWYR